MVGLCELYREQGVDLGSLATVAETGNNKEALKGKVIICPPSAVHDRWSRRLPDPVTAMASGWMTVRARARQKLVELPLVISDHADWDELAMAAATAYRRAGITDPLNQIDVAEIYAPFTCTELAAVEALGFCPKGMGGRMGEQGMFDIRGPMPVNPSGGVLSANPISATALARIAEAALQVMGDAGEHQVPGVHRAVATGIGGTLQFHTCMVLGDDL